MGAFKRDGNWWVDYYEPSSRRRRRKIGSSRNIADLALKDVQIRIAKGEYLGIREKKIRFDELGSSTWSTPKPTRPRTASEGMSSARTPILSLVSVETTCAGSLPRRSRTTGPSASGT
jgi:hypothetical protein